jgi:GPN-loop GTPase
MLQMDLTHLNVLTKIDNLHKYPSLPFSLDFYADVQDLSYLLPLLAEESPLFAKGKFSALNQALVDLVEEFGLVGFETLAVEDKKSMMTLLQTIDRAGGYAFGGAEGANDTVWQVAVREGMCQMDIRDIQDRWIDNKDEWDEKEKKEWDEAAKMREENGGDGGDDDDDLDEMDVNIPANSGVKVTRTPAP